MIKMKKILIFILCSIPFIAFSQELDNLSDEAKEKFLKETLESLNGLTEKGLEMRGDSLIVSDELLTLMSDNELRAQVFPEVYTWEEAIEYMTSMKLKTAFWFFINLYPENDTSKKAVLNAVFSYDKMMKMDEVLTNTFNTYCYADPEICKITNGKPEIIRPDIMEEKLRNVKEIILYIQAFREQSKKDSQNK